MKPPTEVQIRAIRRLVAYRCLWRGFFSIEVLLDAGVKRQTVGALVRLGVLQQDDCMYTIDQQNGWWRCSGGCR